ncbi:MAG: sigma-70 family RNA polymerase sigma factor [Flavobacteriales bacterium]|nr:sigma-70 family RNA polymerase sigma factor [Flavobacteriales bacterium]
MKLLLNNDSHLIKQCARGNRKAQRTLYERYHVLMHKVCLGYASDREMAKDMLQEGFIRVYKNIGSFKNNGSFDGWVRRVFVNSCLNYIRSNRIGNFIYLEKDEALEPHLAHEENDALNQLDVNDFEIIISKLPLGYRTVLNLFFVEGYTHDEIAKSLEITTGTSKSQLAKAKRKLRNNIDDYFDKESLLAYAK